MKKTIVTLLALMVIFSGCREEGLDGRNSLMDLIEEPSGGNCSSGGYKINVGIDLNNNNILEESEIQNTRYICNGINGINGKSSLMNIIPEPSGEICTAGGYKIVSGLDLNQNNSLDEDEIQVTEYICNGVDGSYDRQIRLSIIQFPDNHTYSVKVTSGIILGKLPKFNKMYWEGVDSIVFVPQIHSSNSSNPAHTAIAELYDLTHNVVIENSLVETTNNIPTNLVSRNIINYLPEGEIDLAMRVRPEVSPTLANITGNSYLILYRND